MEAQVAGREVKLLVIGWVVGDVHLTVFAGNGAVAFYHHRSVVTQSSGTLLEERGDQDYGALTRHVAVELGGRAGNRLCKIEIIGVFYLTEIRRVVQFLQHYEFCARSGCLSDVSGHALAIIGSVGGAMGLHEGGFEKSHGRDY